MIRVEDNLAYVTLGKGFEAVVDVDDIPLIEGVQWKPLTTTGGHIYAIRHRSRANGPYALMHRLLLDAPRGYPVDHKDGDGLNNRRSNIRVSTPSLNAANRGHDRRNKLLLKGVYVTRHGKFCATIQHSGKTINLGHYATPEEASAAYYGAARVLWGDFASR